MISERSFHLEACVFSLEQALQAEALGADRVEVCIRLETEGMTPDMDLVSTLCIHLHIPVRVMIRATEVGFEADGETLQEMILSIRHLKRLPVNGFVLGVMKNNLIDREAMVLLVEEADPLPVTFHKAIDLSEDLTADLDWINRFPQIDTILSSGGAAKAIDGISQLLMMKSKLNGSLMAAGKITPEVLPALHESLGLSWYHGRAIV